MKHMCNTDQLTKNPTVRTISLKIMKVTRFSRCLFPKVYYSDGTPKELDSSPQGTYYFF